MKLVGAILVGALASVAGMSAVFAHAEPATAKPGDDAVLTQVPGEIVLVMSQEMARQAGGNDIDVFDAAGIEATTVAAVVDNSDRKRLSVPVPSSLVPGTYSVKWKTLSSEDGDPAAGTLSFTYNPTGAPNPGKEELREGLLPTGTEAGGAQPGATRSVGDEPDGVTWILVVAVGLGMFVLGAGGAFLLVQKKP